MLSLGVVVVLSLPQSAAAFPHCSGDVDPRTNPSGLPRGDNGKCSNGLDPIDLAGSPTPPDPNDPAAQNHEGDINVRKNVTCGSFTEGGTDPGRVGEPGQSPGAGIGVSNYGWKSICDHSQKNVVMGLVVGISNWIVGLVGLVIVLMITIGGVQMVASAGSPDAVKAAKSKITNAIMSLVVLISMRAILALVSIGAGQQEFFGVPIADAGEKLSSVPLLIVAIINFTLFLGGGLAVIFIIVGALRYIGSAGNQANLQKAKATLTYAILGLVVAISALAIVNFIINNLK